MHRIFVTPAEVHRHQIELRNREEVHHLTRVLRAKVGEAIVCLDGAGCAYHGTISAIDRHSVTVEVKDTRTEPPPLVQITIAQALITAERFEWALQKLTELGVTRIIPLVTERCMVKIEQKQESVKLERWRRICREASKQCGWSFVPEVTPPMELSRALASCSPEAMRLLPTLRLPGPALSDVLGGARALQEVCVLIGPEGDFTPEEAREAATRGAQAVSLGSRTLRTETASIAVAAILQYAAGAL